MFVRMTPRPLTLLSVMVSLKSLITNRLLAVGFTAADSGLVYMCVCVCVKNDTSTSRGSYGTDDASAVNSDT